MTIKERLSPITDTTDGDKTWEPNHILYGVLEVTANSSSDTVKKFPNNSTMVYDGRMDGGDATDLVIWNQGSEDFNLAIDGGTPDYLVGNLVVPAGGFTLVKFIVGYGTGGRMAIFCV